MQILIAAILVITVILDIKLSGRYLMVPSLNQIFIFFIFFVYCIPFFALYSEPLTAISMLGQLSEYEVQNLMNYLFSFVLFYGIFYLLLKGYLPTKTFYKLDKRPSEKRLVVIFLIALIVKYLYLGTGLGFSPSVVIDRFFDPRSYTYIKQGTGYINFLNSASLHTLLFYCIYSLVQSKRSLGLLQIIIIILSLVLVLGGGSKQNFMWGLFYWIIISQKVRPRFFRSLTSYFKNALNLVILGLGSLAGILLMFAPSSQSSRNALEILTDYQQEAFYGAKVLSDFTYKFEYTLIGVYDHFISIVPRGIWPGKPIVGFYDRFWRPVYQTDTVEYHTSTYGILSEAFFMFGSLGPLIYGLFSALLIVKLERAYAETKRISTIFVVAFMAINFYFIVRAGYYAFQFWYILIVICIGLLLLKSTWSKNIGERLNV